MGKIFKPDLRKRAITRVYDKALEDKGLAARVESVTEDKRRGLVAHVAANGASQDDVSAVLSEYTVAWDMAE